MRFAWVFRNSRAGFSLGCFQQRIRKKVGKKTETYTSTAMSFYTFEAGGPNVLSGSFNAFFGIEAASVSSESVLSYL